MTNNPNPDDLFCPNCGANIDGQVSHDLEEIDGNVLITHFDVYIYQMGCCKAYVQDGEFLNKAEARDQFS